MYVKIQRITDCPYKFCSPVDESTSHTALEEATAAIAGVDAIVFTTA